MRNAWVYGLCALSLVSVSSVSWADAATAKNKVFNHIDGDGDGAISQDEMATTKNNVINRLDKNGDGKLGNSTPQERIENAKGRIRDRVSSRRQKLQDAASE